MGAQTRHHAGAFHLHRLIKKENDCKRNTDRENQVSQPVARIEEVRVPFPASRRRRRISAWGWRMILPVRHHLIFIPQEAVFLPLVRRLLCGQGVVAAFSSAAPSLLPAARLKPPPAVESFGGLER